MSNGPAEVLLNYHHNPVQGLELVVYKGKSGEVIPLSREMVFRPDKPRKYVLRFPENREMPKQYKALSFTTLPAARNHPLREYSVEWVSDEHIVSLMGILQAEYLNLRKRYPHLSCDLGEPVFVKPEGERYQEIEAHELMKDPDFFGRWARVYLKNEMRTIKEGIKDRQRKKTKKEIKVNGRFAFDTEYFEVELKRVRIPGNWGAMRGTKINLTSEFDLSDVVIDLLLDTRLDRRNKKINQVEADNQQIRQMLTEFMSLYQNPNDYEEFDDA
jgi:hypothetical protein